MDYMFLHKVQDLRQRELLLQTMVDGLFTKAFPSSGDRITIDELREGMNERPIPLVIAVSGRHLHDAKPVIEGLSIVKYFPKSECAMPFYTARDRKSLSKHYAATLRNTAIGEAERLANQQGRGLEGVFAEVHDPEKWVGPDERVPGKKTDVMDPKRRIKLFETLQGKVVNIDHVAPALEGDALFTDDMCLLSYPIPGRGTYANERSTREMLREYYTTYLPPERFDPVTDQDFNCSARQLAMIEAGKRPFYREPLGRKRQDELVPEKRLPEQAARAR